MKFLRLAAFTLAVIMLCAYFSEYLYKRNFPPDVNEPENKEENDLKVPIKQGMDFTSFAQGEPLVQGVSVSARSAILCSGDGVLIYEKNADTPLPMASITKVMSVICALERINDLSSEVRVPKEAVGIEGSSVYLTDGEIVSVEMLVYSAMLESANDAVTALAIAVGGDCDSFVDIMNEKAKSLSMNSTNFKNPHGLSENDHFTTARDYAKLMAYAIQNETFCKVIATKKAVYPKYDNSMTRVLTNHNRLLNTYPDMLGGKTGFTKVSGRTLVTAARRGETTLICVTLDAPNDWDDHTALFEVGFDTVQTLKFTPNELSAQISVSGGERQNVNVNSYFDVFVTVKKGESVSVSLKVEPSVFAPVKRYAELGRAELIKDGECILSAPLYANESVPHKK